MVDKSVFFSDKSEFYIPVYPSNEVEVGEVYKICEFPGCGYSRFIIFDSDFIVSTKVDDVIEIIDEDGDVLDKVYYGKVTVGDDVTYTGQFSIEYPLKAKSENETQYIGIRWTQKGGAQSVTPRSEVNRFYLYPQENHLSFGNVNLPDK